MFFQPLRTYIDVKFHGESISDGFRAIRERKVGQKLKNPRKKVAKLDSQVTILEILSRPTPHQTVVYNGSESLFYFHQPWSAENF